MISFVHYGGLSNVVYGPLFLVAIVLTVVLGYQRIGMIQRYRHAQCFVGYSITKEYFRFFLLSFVFLGLFLMLLRPQWTQKEQSVPQQGKDILFLLDISRSMRVEDVKPNRLEQAKFKIKQLLRSFSYERVGLILFSGTAFVQSPLTNDYATLEMFLDQVDIETIASGTTALDRALLLGIDLFNHMPEKKHKTMLVITDGEDFSTNFDLVLKKSKEQKISIATLGIATDQGGPIPIFNHQGAQVGVERDAQGTILLSLRNDALLQKIADQLNGFYTPVTQDNSDIRALKAFFDRIEKEIVANEQVSQWEDRYYLIAWILFPLLLLEWFL